jgi:sugar lactone lactonase YvrE
VIRFRPRHLVVLTATLVTALTAVASPAASAARARFDTQVLALIPRPGFPALPIVVGDRIYEGTYANMGGDFQKSRVFEFQGDGTLTRSWTVAGQDLSRAHGVQVATSDARGRLIVLLKTTGQGLQLDRNTGEQRLYTTFPDVPTCSAAPAGAQCSQTGSNDPPSPNYAAWGSDGSLYVTDYAQGLIWRVPPGGGEAKVWLTDPKLDGGPFGTTGLEILPDHKTLLFTQGSSAGGGEPNPTTGKLYSVAIQADGRPGPITLRWESAATALPDGFAIAKSGRIYLAEAGLTSQLIVLGPDYKQLEAFPSTPFTGMNGSPVPFDTPSGVAFYGTRLIVANQSALAATAANQALLDVETGEEGVPDYIPANAGITAADVPALTPQSAPVRSLSLRVPSRGAPTVRFRIVAAGTVRLTVSSVSHGSVGPLATITRMYAGPGSKRVVLSGRLATRLRRAGRYRVMATLQSTGERRSVARSAFVRVR